MWNRMIKWLKRKRRAPETKPAPAPEPAQGEPGALPTLDTARSKEAEVAARLGVLDMRLELIQRRIKDDS